MRRVLMTIPLILVLILGGFLYWGLNPDRDPNKLPSPLIGKSVPVFNLGPIAGVNGPGLATEQLTAVGGIKVVNFFASWCVPCRAEHRVLGDLARSENFPIYGVNYKDKAEDAAKWLAELGNPYVAIGADFSGQTGLKWGLSGVPETLIVSGDGIVLHHTRGPIVGQTAVRDFKEALEEARK